MLRFIYAGVICVLILGHCMPGAALAADIRVCRIDRVSGTAVFLTTAGVRTNAVGGQEIPPDAELATGPETRVALSCDDGTTVTLGPETEVVLDGLTGRAGPDENVIVRLLAGIVGIVAPNRTWNRFEVETEVAIASVRSTEWLVEVNSLVGTAVYVASGKVDVRVSEQDFVLTNGEGVSVPTGQSRSGGLRLPSPQVGRWSGARVARYRTALGFDWE